MGKRALIYTRVSKDTAQGRSPAEQEAESRTVCERAGWEVSHVVTDSVGASRHSKGKRTGWNEAHRLLGTGDFDVLVTWECSRAQRDLSAYAELRDLCVRMGVLWSYSGHTYDMGESGDRFRTGLDALVAEREADETAERVQRAMRSNATAGRPHGRRLFGYRRVYDPTTGVLVNQEPEEVEADVVRSIFADYLAGCGLRTIATRLNDAEITTGTGAKWHDAQIRRVLINPAYAARRVHQGEVIGAAIWPEIVDPRVFDQAAARQAAQAEGMTRQTGTARLLTGVGRCGVCGGKLSAGHDRNKRKMYQCRANFCVARDLVKLDWFVSEQIIEHFGMLGADAIGHPEGVEAGAEARALADELRHRLDAAVAEFTSGRISAATLAKVETSLHPRIVAAEREVRRSIVPMDVEVPATGIADWWYALPIEQRRAIVSAIVVSVAVSPVRRGTRRFDSTAIDIDWRRG
jgi:site-specific DNA recombinase